MVLKQSNSSQNISKSKISLFLIIFIEGMCVMTVELGTAQILTPFYGNYLSLWTTVLGMTLLFLALGYYLGGLMTHKRKHDTYINWVLLSISLSIALLPIVSRQITKISDALPWDIGWVFTAFILLSIPLTLLGMLPAIIIQYNSEKFENSGKNAGNVFTISTIGNIVAAYLLGFFLIPQIGVTISIAIISFLMLLLSFFVLLKKNKFTIIFFVLIVIINGSSFKNKTANNSSYRLIDFKEGLMGQLIVLDLPTYSTNGQSGWNRMILNNKMVQTYNNLETQSTLWSYPSYTSSISSIYHSGSKALLVGLGGGNIANILQNQLNINVTAVDLDKRMKDIAKKRFGLSPKVNVVIDDGRHFVKTTNEKYSIIIFDTFRGESIPSYLLTKEFFDEVKKILNPDGIIIFNFYGFLSGSKGTLAKAVYKTLHSSELNNVYIVPTHEQEETYRSILFVASAKPVNFESASLPLLINGVAADWEKIPIQLSAQELSDVSVLRDDLPIQELWILDAVKIWRQKNYENLTKDLIKNGVPLFN